jgi:hypothetical protein
MTDKTTLAGIRESSRKQLVREHYEVHRDLEWAERFEPKFRELNSSPEAMRHYRQAWDMFSEDRDWEHWRDEETRRTPSEELKAEIAWYKAEAKAIEMRRSMRDQADPPRETFRDILCQSSGQLCPDLIQTQMRSNHQ